MRPAAVAVDFGPSDPDSPTEIESSSDFEQVPYPDYNHTTNHSQFQDEPDLPLHYMTEEKARRRVVKGQPQKSAGLEPPLGEFDEDVKDVYAKIRPGVNPRVSSGRLRYAPPPPPTSIVCVRLFFS